MKRNIDLTQNRMFSFWSQDNSSDSIIINTIRDELFKQLRIPWKRDDRIRVIHSDDEFDLGHQKRSIIALGDKAMRAKIKEYREMDSENYCDCCGSRMNLKPWDREYGVCRKCDEYFEINQLGVDRCKWRKKEQIRSVEF